MEKKFTLNDTNPVNYEEFGKLIEGLKDKVENYFKEHGEKVDIIVPLLRTGAITGGILSIKLKVLPMLPVQFKYYYHPTEIKQILSLPEILLEVPENPNILMCEGNTSSGSIAKKTAKLLREKYPNSRIYHATLTKVYGGPETLEGIEKVFYGVETDENFIATDKEREEKGLRWGITIFPWESPEEELSDINAM